jgi:hypothetical protein
MYSLSCAWWWWCRWEVRGASAHLQLTVATSAGAISLSIQSPYVHHSRAHACARSPASCPPRRPTPPNVPHLGQRLRKVDAQADLGDVGDGLVGTAAVTPPRYRHEHKAREEDLGLDAVRVGHNVLVRLIKRDQGLVHPGISSPSLNASRRMCERRWDRRVGSVRWGGSQHDGAGSRGEARSGRPRGRASYAGAWLHLKGHVNSVTLTSIRR